MILNHKIVIGNEELNNNPKTKIALNIEKLDDKWDEKYSNLECVFFDNELIDINFEGKKVTKLYLFSKEYK